MLPEICSVSVRACVCVLACVRGVCMCGGRELSPSLFKVFCCIIFNTLSKLSTVPNLLLNWAIMYELLCDLKCIKVGCCF